MDLSPKEVPLRSTESQSPWKAKEVQILEGIDKKVGIITAFRSELDACTLQDPQDRVQQRLQGFLSGVIQQFPPDVIDGYQKYQALDARIKTATRDSISLGSDWEDDEERERLLQNPDVRFLATMRQLTDDLVRKNQQVHDFIAKPDTLKPILSELGERGFALDRAKDIRYQPFSITFIVDRPDLPSSADYAGLHFSGTPFNIALDRGVATERTVRHEEIHNRIDGAKALESIDPRKIVKGKFDRLEKTSPIMARILKIDLMKLRPAELVNHLQNEMLAHVQTAETDRFQTNYADIVQAAGLDEGTFKMMFDGTNDLNRYAGIFSTAGRRMLELLQFLDQQAKTAKDPDIRESSRSLRKKVGDMFTGSVMSIETGLSIGARISEDAHLATHMLLYVLKPSQYHHINRFLRYKYGNAAVEAAIESKALGDLLSFYPEELKVFVAQAEKQKGKISPVDKEKIEERIRSFNVWDYGDLAIDLNTRKQYQTLLERAGEALGIDVSNSIPRILKGLSEARLFDQIREDLGDNFDHLPNIYQALNAEDREIFADMLSVYMASDILDDLKSPEGRKLTTEELRTTRQWDVVRQLGLEEKVDAAIQKEELREKNAPPTFSFPLT